MSDQLEITVIMPCLNEAETLEVCIQKAEKSIEAHSLKGEVLIADNGSTDGSQQIAEKNGARVVPIPAKGYGAALLGGIEAAKGKYVIMGDADDSYDFSNIFPFVEKLRQGYDLVMGCRLPRGGGTIMPGAMPLKHRYLGNPALSFIGRLFFESQVTDFHCGLRGFSKEAFKKMDLHTTGMEFASEMVIKATLLKMKVAEFPITLHKDGRSRPPHLRSWRDGWRHLRFMLMFAPNWLFLIPGMVLGLLGVLSFGVLVQGPVVFGSVRFDTNSLLISAMAILLGYQLVNFYFFVRTFSLLEGLIPDAPVLNRMFSVFTLEVGIVIGILLFGTGLGFLSASILHWGETGFGDLSYPISLRKVVPAVMLIVLGVQTIFSSFFMSILGLRRK